MFRIKLNASKLVNALESEGARNWRGREGKENFLLQGKEFFNNLKLKAENTTESLSMLVMTIQNPDYISVLYKAPGTLHVCL